MMSRLLVSIVVGLGLVIGLQSCTISKLEDNIKELNVTLSRTEQALNSLEKSQDVIDYTLREYTENATRREKEFNLYYAEVQKKLEQESSDSCLSSTVPSSVANLLCNEGNSSSKYCYPSSGTYETRNRTNP